MIKESEEYYAEPKRNIFASLLLLIGFIMLGLILGNLAGIVISLPLFGADYQSLLSAFTDPASSPYSRQALLIIQACSSLFGFIFAPLAFWKFIEKKSVPSIFHNRYLEIVLILLVGVSVIGFMLANSVVIEWNMNLDLGLFSASFEEWASAKEEELKELTEYITRFESIGGLLVGVLVIAVFPAIGEELVFRGLGQRMLQGLTRSPHAGIWIAAFLFSFIHLQFYGFFPRFLLGALFGYLYYWSGNLWYPIFAHFVNNGFTLIMLYLYQQKTTDLNVEATEVVPLGTALLALLVTIGLLIYFRKRIFQLRMVHDER
ncbi:CPBP family intramembrane glutamic endopeptidase [Catalinimonas niigatensis]|uniref:CPBP family intramembrane glutamic endopeptidase n=1 Tax=Catalinimonas niigatensis TaxID=1397264 RepID=UPI002666F018|nr:CPBP family intramembrane glutamic endopeptidase [Catalinimonas niigatensis]WPP48512.1 CPBP family intramembrane glutamic endopeptidase [Catalinimonas niigatensis]